MSLQDYKIMLVYCKDCEMFVEVALDKKTNAPTSLWKGKLIRFMIAKWLAGYVNQDKHLFQLMCIGSCAVVFAAYLQMQSIEILYWMHKYYVGKSL